MKKILLVSLVALVVTAGGASAQMMGGRHMMGTVQQPQAQAQIQQGAQPFVGMMGYGMYPGMVGGYGMHQPMMGYGVGHMYPGRMSGYGMHRPMLGYGMHPGMMGFGAAPCLSGSAMSPPMMGYGMGQGMHKGMAVYGMPQMYAGAGGDVEKQREFMKETSKLRRKLHDLMFDYMEAQWNPDIQPEQIEKLGTEMQGLQQELFEKSREMQR